MVLPACAGHGRQATGLPHKSPLPSGERDRVRGVYGGHHLLESESDQRRTDFLVKGGYQVLRFWDHEVLTESEMVLEQILRALQSPSPQPSP